MTDPPPLFVGLVMLVIPCKYDPDPSSEKEKEKSLSLQLDFGCRRDQNFFRFLSAAICSTFFINIRRLSSIEESKVVDLFILIALLSSNDGNGIMFMFCVRKKDSSSEKASENEISLRLRPLEFCCCFAACSALIRFRSATRSSTFFISNARFSSNEETIVGVFLALMALTAYCTMLQLLKDFDVYYVDAM